jgi:23S rRNA pseudouridine2604 synthase
MTEPVRLAKRVARLRGVSRSEAEHFIAGGWVRVGGKVVEEPQFRVQDETIEIDPAATALALPPVTLLLHKPAGEQAAVDAAHRSADDRSVIHRLKRHLDRLGAPTPLPLPASGLVVLTQDGRVLRKLTEDAATIEQELIVQVSGEATPDRLRRLCHGLPAVKVSINSQTGTETRLRFALKGVSAGQLPAMCERVDLAVIALKRIRIGRVPLGPLAPGQWRFLLPQERF